jgi:ribosomal-protein-alanine N-acetyltransferase
MSVQQTMDQATRSPFEPECLVWSRGTDQQAEAAAQLASRAFDPHFRESWNEAQIRGLLQGPSGWLELASTGRELVAFALCRQAVDEVELLLCAVDPARRAQGIGRRLVQRVSEGARAVGARRLFLEVRDSNLPALALYRSCGFQIAGRRPAYYRTLSGQSIDALTLALAMN